MEEEKNPKKRLRPEEDSEDEDIPEAKRAKVIPSVDHILKLPLDIFRQILPYCNMTAMSNLIATNSKMAILMGAAVEKVNFRNDNFRNAYQEMRNRHFPFFSIRHAEQYTKNGDIMRAMPSATIRSVLIEDNGEGKIFVPSPTQKLTYIANDLAISEQNIVGVPGFVVPNEVVFRSEKGFKGAGQCPVITCLVYYPFVETSIVKLTLQNANVRGFHPLKLYANFVKLVNLQELTVIQTVDGAYALGFSYVEEKPPKLISLTRLNVDLEITERKYKPKETFIMFFAVQELNFNLKFEHSCSGCMKKPNTEERVKKLESAQFLKVNMESILKD